MEIKTTDTNFEEEVINSSLPVLVDFWAEWCTPCHMVAPAVKSIAKKYQGKLKVCKVNVDEAPNTSSANGIMSIPTLAIFKNGKIEDKIVGALSAAELEAVVKPHIDLK
jgi:thioredoxin 1